MAQGGWDRSLFGRLDDQLHTYALVKIRWDPRGQRFPSLRGNFIVDTYRGQIRVRSWPRKAGPPKSLAVRRQVKWFSEANRLAKRVEPTQQNLAIAMTLGTGLYPRDLILRQMSGGMYAVIEDGGREIEARKRFREKKVFNGIITQLDADQVLPALTTTIFNWPLPVIDTNGFWSAAAPSRLTIPDGVEAVELTGGWADNSAGPATGLATFIFLNSSVLTRMAVTGTGTPGITTQRGPWPVAAGDYFEFGVFPNLAQRARGDEQTFFTLNVLQSSAS